MTRHSCAALLLAAAGLLTACGGGGGDGDQANRASYGKLVVFGDSLSDVGSYKVSTVAAVGGGRYTVNSGGGENWTELISAQLRLTAPCAALTGLNVQAPLTAAVPAVMPPTAHTGCFSYAQGGARVTNPVGPGNALLGATGVLGQLTVPIVTQIANHLAVSGGSFAATDLVVVMAGGNDAIINIATFGATVTAGGASVAAAASTAAVSAMVTAADDLAGYVNTQLLGKGAQRVLVVNLPDLANTPFGVSTGAGQPVLTQMVASFNARLAADLAPLGSKVLLVDAYTVNHDQIINPSQYALTNVTTPACDLNNAFPHATAAAAAASLLGTLKTSLVCSTATTIAGDTSHYLFADTVHPTPFGYNLLAQLVTDRMVKAGWL
jgi:phospholipase/lecithinase/hemolysin